MVKAKTTFAPQRQALEETVAALTTSPEHSALIESCRRLADIADLAEGFDDKLWHEYRMSLRALMDRASGGGGDDFDAEFDALRTAVGNSAKS